MFVQNKRAYTRVSKKMCNYTWYISDYSLIRKKTGEKLESPKFTVGKNEAKTFSLILFPAGVNADYVNSVALCLHHEVADVTNGLEVYCTFSISNNEITLEKSKFINFTKNWNSVGWNDFCTKEDFIRFISNSDCVTIHCNLTVILGYESIARDAKALIYKEKTSKEQKVESLFLCEKFSDIKLKTACGKVVHAHKAILASASTTFSAMFSHEMLENKLSCVNIIDIHYDVLVELLRYIYLGWVENMETLACELIAAADKYEIEGLKSECEHFLSDNLSVDNAYEVLCIADRHNIKDLKIQSLEFIKSHIKEVIQSDKVQEVKKNEKARLLIDLICSLIGEI
ncbi:hypothetical protein TKK_0018960 [Trichogramma kaykai]|uniref:BTB domain-containing protein n=1 Tax=Trichogramma kaykai TaxID=54128 RepID=A0ABD2VUX0_9HYME